MSRYKPRTWWCADCNLYPVPGPNQQCEECSGVELDWDRHVAPLLSTPLTRHWPEPVKRPVPRETPIPAAEAEVTYHPRRTA